jgi:hypothetical protein
MGLGSSIGWILGLGVSAQSDMSHCPGWRQGSPDLDVLDVVLVSLALDDGLVFCVNAGDDRFLPVSAYASRMRGLDLPGLPA